jgi:ankyrin repeat protein
MPLSQREEKTPEEKLLEALNKDDLDGLKEAMELEANLNKVDLCDNTAMHIAAQNGSIKIVKYLFEDPKFMEDFDIDQPNLFGHSALNVACLFSQLGIVKILIEQGADVNSFGPDYCDPGKQAIDSYIRTKNYADLNNRKKLEKTLYLLLKAGLYYDQPYILQKVTEIDLPSIKNKLENTHALFEALKHGDIECAVKELEAIKQITLPKDLFLNAVNVEGNTPFLIAAQICNKQIIELLLENAKFTKDTINIINNTDKYLNTALHLITKSGNKECLDLLLDIQNISMILDQKNKEGDACLHLAAKFGHLECLKALLNQSAIVDIKNGNDQTPLDIAIQNNQQSIIDFLAPITTLYNGLKENSLEKVKDAFSKELPNNIFYLGNNTPLHLAVEFNCSIGIISFLLTKGFVVDTPNNDLNTALHLVTRSGNKESLDLLLNTEDTFMILDQKNKEGDTCLHLAAKFGHLECLKALLNQSAIVDIKNGNDQIPLDIAIQNNKQSIIDFLAPITTLYNGLKENSLKKVKEAFSKELPNNIVYLGNNTPLHLAVEFNCSIGIISFLLTKGVVVDAPNNNGKRPLDLIDQNNPNGCVIRKTLEYGNRKRKRFEEEDEEENTYRGEEYYPHLEENSSKGEKSHPDNNEDLHAVSENKKPDEGRGGEKITYNDSFVENTNNTLTLSLPHNAYQNIKSQVKNNCVSSENKKSIEELEAVIKTIENPNVTKNTLNLTIDTPLEDSEYDQNISYISHQYLDKPTHSVLGIQAFHSSNLLIMI